MRLMLGLLIWIMCPSAWAAIDCTIVAPDLDFGIYDHLDISPLNSNANMTVTCQEKVLVIGGGGNLNYAISMDTGNSTSYNPREMNSASDSLMYNLYTDPARSIIWGDGSSGSATRSNSISVPLCLRLLLVVICPSESNNEAVYGRIPAQQSVDEGSYSDSIMVTVTF